MSLILKDRVKETSTTTGTGTYTLAGAVTGFESFGEVGNGNTTYYTCTDGTDFETGIGTYTASGTTLARTTILQSSNSDNAVNWGAGTRTLFVTLPAEKMSFKDASNNVNFADNEKAIFGAGSDLQVFHSGTHSWINENGTGNLYIQSSGAAVNITNGSTRNLAQFNTTAGTVTLYHDNGTSSSAKLATNASGIDVTGVITTDGMTTSADINFGDNNKAIFGAGSDLQIYHDASHSYVSEQGTGSLRLLAENFAVLNAAETENMILAVPDGAVTLFYNGNTKLQTSSSGIDVTGNATFADNGKAVFGAGSDLQIYHDGSASRIDDAGTGDLILRSSSIQLQKYTGETMAGFVADGAVTLRYDNALKLATTSTGVEVTGTLAATAVTGDGSGLTNLPGGGGGGAELYAANPDSATDPTAGGLNSVAIGTNAVVTDAGSGINGSKSIAIGHNSSITSQNAIGVGRQAAVSGAYASGFGYKATSAGTQSHAATHSYASGANSFAAAIASDSSSYGATGANGIAIGKQAKATATSTIAIGESSTGGTAYGIAVGYQANASGTGAIAIGNQYYVGQTTASGGSSIAIGDDAKATQKFATAIGSSSSAAIIGKYAYAGGRFAATGDSQGGQFILRADTTDATATVLTTNNSAAAATNQIVAASDTCITFDGTIVAMQNGAQAFASFRIEGLLVNDGGTTTLANSATTVIDNQSSWTVAMSADNTNNALAITVTGEASHNIRWVANIRTSEVTYA